MSAYQNKLYKQSDDYEDRYENHSDVSNLLSSCQDADQDMRNAAREAHLFVDKRNGQWEPYFWNANEKKPRYTFDMVSPIIDQQASGIESAEYSIRVSPAGGDATKKVAMTLDGLIRNIQNISGATDIYGSCARGMITSGLDGWRITQKYIDDDSFDQDLIIERVGNWVDRVWFDPASENPDGSDARYAFCLHPMSVDEYYERFPEGSGESVSDGSDASAYFDKAETIVVGEFLYREAENRELVLYSNGATYVFDEDFKKIEDELKDAGLFEVERRKRKNHKVCSRFFDNSDWLEDKKETVFNKIPLVPLYGNFKIVENKRIYRGVVEKLLDPQRVLNYSLSREIEEGALAPRAKYWVTETQAAGHQAELETLNTNADPVQFYNADPEAPVPQQQGGAQINAGLKVVSDNMKQMMTASAGLYAASLGDNPNAQSGVAIRQLQDKGEAIASKFTRAMEVAIEYTGQILVDAIPQVYANYRTVRILKEDKSVDMVKLNQTVIDEETQEPVIVNDLNVGIYDVTCNAGPSYKNKQQETIETIVSMAQVDPSIMQIAGDLLLQNVSTPAATQIAERKRSQMIAGGLIPQEQMTEVEIEAMQTSAAQGQQAPDPAMIAAQAEMGKAEAEMLKAQADMQKVTNDQMKLQIEARKLELEGQKLQTSLMTDQANLQVDSFRAETDRFEAQSSAEQAGVRSDLDQASTFGKQIDNTKKLLDIQQGQNDRLRTSTLRDLGQMDLIN